VSRLAGYIYAFLAYFTWGLFPLYWRLLSQFSPTEILIHRVFWAAIFFLILALIKRKLKVYCSRFSEKNVRLSIFHGAFWISFNWWIFIYAVQTERVLETSLGYFLCPLLNVALGVLLLKETMNRWQRFAVLLAFIGIAQFFLGSDGIPWIALVLAFTFSFYGYFRKKYPLDPLLNMLGETALMGVVSVLFLLTAWIFKFPLETFYSLSVNVWLVLIFSGIVTGLPLLFFSEAASRLPLSTLGFFQYIAPSLQFLLAVFVFHERLSSGFLWGFLFVWLALGFFVYGIRKNQIPHH